jgi:transketolase
MEKKNVKVAQQIEETPALRDRAINTIRFLAADAVQKANSGHPGLPMGDAALAYALWTRHLRFNPKDPAWPGRDRFILSGGHGSMLLYSLLYLTGYDLPLDEIKRFRQWGSKTPGHPEYGLAPGVEATTGPLGQGFANGVGMAIAARHLASTYDRPGFQFFDYTVYGLVTDGDLMEGISHEAASLAGHLGLGNLIYLYDDNRISIDGSTDLAFTEDRGARFEAYGWQVLRVADGNDVDAVDETIRQAKADPRPSLIICRTHIGYGLPTRQDTEKAHGEAPGEEELRGAKQRLGWPLEPDFYVPDDVLAFFRQALPRGEAWEAQWQERLDAYRAAYPQPAAELERRLAGKLPEGWDQDLPEFAADPKGTATRVASGKVLNALAKRLPELMGGSADLFTSTDVRLEGEADFEKDTPGGRNIHFGVREHGMGGILNGMAYAKAFVPYGSTFLVFSDYLRPALRLSALSSLHTVWVFTHDSIGLGEDGPTHQPVEQLAALRAMPNLVVIRPGDANETREAWKVAVARANGPTALVLSRQAMPVLDRAQLGPAEGLARGAYVLADLGGGRPQIILMASGSELSLVLEAGYRLATQGIDARVVSFPSWELFAAQERSYQLTVLPAEITYRLAVEAGVSFGWERWVGDEGAVLSVERYGASAPGSTVMAQYGFTVENVVAKARELLGRAPIEE